MKTLIINGSPRKNGDSMALVNEMIKYLDGEVQVVNAYDNEIKPCIDCRYCWSHKTCSINDKMQEVYRLLNEVDNVIMSSPIYFSELTGPLLSLASRLQLFYATKYVRRDAEFKLKNKKGVLVISAGGKIKNYERSFETANMIFKEMNVELVGTVCAAHTDKVPAKEDSEALKQARELALELNKNCLFS